ncbi:GntR family transcriptional regulator [Alicyclobacillus sp. SO9]|uniref:GntR family transcriptional regulator n=1 Tax=Alicyclobacillus sp. SO9 TaxID=2665646 RepID=UPI0018E78658|nr:GntR family transcriptional regulator [Alicyclobacillus sp. SO9]QQE79273.1 GntR family transcriptional regulator [Alicyclobacillus sp. SO9]
MLRNEAVYSVLGHREPLYLQVIEEIQQKLSTKEWDIGEKIPSEDELSEMFGISRATLREAVSYLIQRGVLERRRGVGTFVSTRIQGGLESLVSVTQWIEKHGYKPGTKNVEFSTRAITRKEKELLKNWDMEEVGVIRRIRTADDVPVMHCVDILPLQYMPANEADMGESLFVYLETKFREIVTTADTSIDVGHPSQGIAEKLEVLPETALLHLHQVHLNQKGFPLLISEDYFLPSRFRLEIFRRRW